MMQNLETPHQKRAVEKLGCAETMSGITENPKRIHRNKFDIYLVFLAMWLLCLRENEIVPDIQ
jgi:hypothetical protein